MNTIQTTLSTLSSTTHLAFPSDSAEHPKIQTPTWVAENKATGENTVWKFNNTTKQTELKGKVLYDSFDSNSELMVSKP